GDDGDPELVLLVDAETAHELVGERGLAGPAGSGEAEHGGAGLLRGLGDPAEEGLVEVAELRPGDRPGDGRTFAGEHRLERDGALLPYVGVAVLDEGVDHARQAEPLPVLGGEDRHPGLAET